MHSFEKTSLWRNSLGSLLNDDESDARDLLRNQFFNLRRLVDQLTTLVVRDLPGMTVHGISHLDALWETASLIAGDDYKLNPAEAFVFGAAILLHDAGMTLAAYPEGLSALKRTPQWQDAVAALLQAETGTIPSAEAIASPTDEIVRSAVPEVLRELHAEVAERLPFLEWKVGEEPPQHLIQDVDIRNAYGSIIGKVAASHWLPATSLSRLPARINAGPEIPSQWFVQPIKLACLLRTADAAQIDHRRAPHFLRALLQPQGVAVNHWTFQSKLGKPSADKHFLVYTGGPFRVDDVEAWWLCYEMICVVDEELRGVQSVLDSHRLPQFAVSAVKGAKSAQGTAELVTTEGWRPVDTELKVTDVPALVKLLGGERLYGADGAIALRELIQNAADAVKARQAAQPGRLQIGEIHVRLRREQDGSWWIEVEDDGIGMSPRVLTGALLDFGRSFWRSPQIRREFPGLLAKGLQPTGRYGIGFFSVFMLGDRVTVTTRRYDAGAAETYTLDFLKGLGVRPILRDATPTEASMHSGTCVRVQLRKPPADKGGLLDEGANSGRLLAERLKTLVTRQCPGIDVSVDVEQVSEKRERTVTANDWISIEATTLLSRVNKLLDDRLLKHMAIAVRELRDPGTSALYGRACIYPAAPYYSNAGVVTVGGFRAADVSGLAGLLVGESLSVSRNSAIPSVPAPLLRTWATEQSQILAGLNLSDAEKHRASAIVLALGGSAGSLPIAIQEEEYLSASRIEEIVRTLDEVVVYDHAEIDHDDDDDVTRRHFSEAFKVSPSLFLVPDTEPVLVSAGVHWPTCLPGLFQEGQPRTCLQYFAHLLSQCWQAEFETAAEIRTVGEVDSVEIVRPVTIYRRVSEQDSDDDQ